MTDAKLTFERFETKYLLSPEQFSALWAELENRVRPDEYFSSTVCSIYYDTPDFTLIRRSIEKPLYKEKLRLRSYNVPGAGGPVFVELKKKYKGTVYKRRAQTTREEAEAWLSREASAPDDTQVCREIDWFLESYSPVPKVFIACDREAWASTELEDLRFTFDRNLRFRENDLSLSAGDGGEPLLDEGTVLMEIKMPGAAPVWLAELLSRLGIFPAGFSKYGACYKNRLLHKYFDGVMDFA